MPPKFLKPQMKSIFLLAASWIFFVWQWYPCLTLWTAAALISKMNTFYACISSVRGLWRLHVLTNPRHSPFETVWLSLSYKAPHCSLPRSSVHRISQVRTLEWVAISFYRGSSWPRDWVQVSCIGKWILFLFFFQSSNIFYWKAMHCLHLLYFKSLYIYFYENTASIF